jgi:hypothetical protein
MPKSRPRSQPLLYMLGFALGGPLVGYLLIGLSTGLKGLVGVLALALLIFPVIVAYIMGAVPAALTGFVAGWSLRWERPWLYLLVTPLAGAIFTIAWNTMLTRRESIFDDYAQGALLGGGSGLICALVGLKCSGWSLPAPAFARTWKAGDVLLAVLLVVIGVMIATLLLPALTRR